MKALLTEILNLPVIIQGALGSFLFWIAFTICSLTFTRLNGIVVKLSASATARNELVKRLKSGAVEFREPFKSYHRSVLHGLAASDALVAAIFVVFGLIASGVLELFGSVAFLIALFYLFRSLTTIQPPESHIELTKKMLRLDAETPGIVDEEIARKKASGGQRAA